jgi:hypothetical protein
MTTATKRRIKRRHGQAGHTLIEIMVAPASSWSALWGFCAS